MKAAMRNRSGRIQMAHPMTSSMAPKRCQQSRRCFNAMLLYLFAPVHARYHRFLHPGRQQKKQFRQDPVDASNDFEYGDKDMSVVKEML